MVEFNRKSVILLILFSLVLASSVLADWWNPFTWNKETNDKVIITPKYNISLSDGSVFTIPLNNNKMMTMTKEGLQCNITSNQEILQVGDFSKTKEWEYKGIGENNENLNCNQDVTIWGDYVCSIEYKPIVGMVEGLWGQNKREHECFYYPKQLVPEEHIKPCVEYNETTKEEYNSTCTYITYKNTRSITKTDKQGVKILFYGDYDPTKTTKTQAEFDNGTYVQMEYNTTLSALTLSDLNYSFRELPSNQAINDYANMTGNVFLMHFNNDSSVGENNTHVVDVSGHGHSGIVGGGNFTTSDGIYGNAMQFDGLDDRVDTSFNGTEWDNLSFSLWFKTNAVTAGEHFYIIDNTPGTSGYYIRVSNDDLVAASYNDSGALSSLTITNIISVDTWYHLVVVMDSSFTVYINGVLNASTARDSNMGSASANMTIGSTIDTSTSVFNGSIDDFAVWNRSLSAAEALAIFNRRNDKILHTNGSYTSAILNTGSNSISDNISFRTELCYQCELPSNGVVETGDFVRGVNMSQNILLLHFNNNSAYGENDTHIYDFSGTGNNGTVVGGNVTTLDGKLARAMQFDGVDDYIEFANDSLQMYPLTAMAWIKTTDTGANRGIIDLYRGGAPRGGLLLTANSGRFDSWFWRDVSNYVRMDGDSVDGGYIADGKWHHVAVTYNDTGGKIYRDGQLINSVGWTGTAGATIPTAIEQYIGRYDSYLEATIDEVAIFNRSLTPTEIADVYERLALRHNDSVRTCATPCTNEAWIDINDTSPQVNLSGNYGVTNNQYLQWRTEFYTDNETISPLLYEFNYSYTQTIIPSLSFVSPTPPNATSTANTSIPINVSINESDLSALKYNWNGTNYTMYDDSLILMMNFDNVSALGENNAVVKDSSIYGNDGEVIGGNYTTPNGKYGSAMQFDGNDLVPVGDITVENTNLSMCAASKFNDLTADERTIISKYNSVGNPTKAFLWRVLTTGAIQFMTHDGTTQTIKATTAGVLSTGIWYHLCLVYDNPKNDSYLYVDGVQVAMTGAALSEIQDIPTDVVIGRWESNNDPMDGSIDEVRIWNRTLSVTEVQQMYMSNLNKYDTDKWYLYVNQSKNSTTGLDVGTYDYYAYALDSYGNSATTETRQVTITAGAADTSAPNVSLIAPANNSAWDTSNTIDFNYSAIDDVGVTNCSLYINGTINASNTGTANFTGITLNNGSYEWFVNCSDAVPNWGYSGTYNLIVNATQETTCPTSLSSNFVYDCSNNCNLTTVDANGYNITWTNSGTWKGNLTDIRSAILWVNSTNCIPWINY